MSVLTVQGRDLNKLHGSCYHAQKLWRFVVGSINKDGKDCHILAASVRFTE